MIVLILIVVSAWLVSFVGELANGNNNSNNNNVSPLDKNERIKLERIVNNMRNG